jgi:hypothetical protein
MTQNKFRKIACILGIAFGLTGVTSVTGMAASPDNAETEPARRPAAAAYEAPSWMKAHRAEQRKQAAWQAEVRAAAAQAVDSPSVTSTPNNVPVTPLVEMPQVEDSDVEALRLQARVGAAERAHLRKAVARRRSGAHGRAERRSVDPAQQSRRQDQSRLEAAQLSRRQDESRLEAAQLSRRQDQSRLEAAQLSRRQDQSRLEAAQESRRQDQARLEAAQAERRRQP